MEDINFKMSQCHYSSGVDRLSVFGDVLGNGLTMILSNASRTVYGSWSALTYCPVV